MPCLLPLPQKVKAMFLVSGWTRDDPQRHIVRVVDGSRLEAAKSALGSITAMHVYSVQPGVPKVGGRQHTACNQGTGLLGGDALELEERRAPDEELLPSICTAHTFCYAEGISSVSFVPHSTLTPSP